MVEQAATMVVQNSQTNYEKEDQELQKMTKIFEKLMDLYKDVYIITNTGAGGNGYNLIYEDSKSYDYHLFRLKQNKKVDKQLGEGEILESCYTFFIDSSNLQIKERRTLLKEQISKKYENYLISVFIGKKNKKIKYKLFGSVKGFAHYQGQEDDVLLIFN